MRNKILLVILGITMFFSMNLNVDAKSKGNYNCEFPLLEPTYNNGRIVTNGMKLKISMKNGKAKLKYKKFKKKDGSDGSYKNCESSTKCDVYTIEFAKNALKKCPTYKTMSVAGSDVKYILSSRAMTEGEKKVSNIVTDSEKVKTNDSTDSSAPEYKLFGDEQGNLSCDKMLGDKLTKRIQDIINIIKIAVPILLIVFGMLDFGKGIFSMDENEMKKSQSKFMKRVIVAVAFFMIPTFIGVILNIASKIWDIDPSLCGIKF